MAVAAFVLVALCALAIGLGFISFNRTIHQDAANLSGLAAIEEYVRTVDTYQEKTNKALDRANYILQQNRLKGVAAPLGNLGHAPEGGDGGTLVFGTWYETDPNLLTPPCPSFPCFKDNPPPNVADPTTTANAVKIITHNQTGGHSNPLLIPFGKILGKEDATVSSQSVAIMVPRCLALLLDVSGSIAGTTHRTSGLYAGPNTPCVNPFPEYLTAPDTAALMAYRSSSLTTFGGDCCRLGNSLEKLLWCNQVNHGLVTRNPSDPIVPYQHFRSDYRDHPSPVGNVKIDSLYDEGQGYYGPEPYSTIFKAFNAVTRLLMQQASVGDQALMLVFTGQLVDRIPPVSGLTNQFGLLAQLTNILNIGLYDRTGAAVSQRVLPNMVYRGWIPLYGTENLDNGTNIPFALYQAINEMATNCPANSKKAIILASDGIGNCTATAPSYTPDCPGMEYSSYEASKRELLQQILPLLQERQISFSYLLTGGASGANFINIPNPDWPVPPNEANDPRRYLTPEQAIALGYGGSLKDEAHQFFKDESSGPVGEVSPDVAFTHIGETGWMFADPNGVLGEMAFSTGGVPCPLMPTADMGLYFDHDGDQGGAACNAPLCANCTPCVLRASKRSPGGAQRYAIEWQSQAEIAAACAIKAIGEDPYALREVPN